MFVHASANRNFICGTADSKEGTADSRKLIKTWSQETGYTEKNLTKLDPYLIPYQKNSNSNKKTE